MIMFAWVVPDDLTKVKSAFKKTRKAGTGYSPVMLYASPKDAPAHLEDSLVKVQIRTEG